MNICIIGDSLTGLSLAKNLINKKINVHLYHKNKIKNYYEYMYYRRWSYRSSIS